MPFVTYRYLEKNGIVPNRTTLARSIERSGFPAPIELGANRLGWDLDEVRAWIASRPRRTPKFGGKKAASRTESEVSCLVDEGLR
jgi:predicted DNA-binding transcriptional regulator AlpA